MKAGLVYALWLVIGVMVIIVLVQQRKLAHVRDENASLRTDARALITTRAQEGAVTAELLRETRLLRSENEQLRRELQQSRERDAGRPAP
jgi:hypothetical protein